MKKVFYIILALFLISGYGFCSTDISNFNLSNSMTMPGDEQILDIIRQFGVDKSQEQMILEQTKKSLKEQLQNCENEPIVKKTNRNIEAQKPHVLDPSKMMKGQKKRR